MDATFLRIVPMIHSIDERSMRDCLKVAVTFYRGFGKDITGGALYFHSYYEEPTKWKYHYDYTMIIVQGVKKICILQMRC